MANWIIDQEGDAVNLDRISAIVIQDDGNDWEVYAYCSLEDLYSSVKSFFIGRFGSQEDAKEYIKSITSPAYSYKSEAHRLAEVLA